MPSKSLNFKLCFQALDDTISDIYTNTQTERKQFYAEQGFCMAAQLLDMINSAKREESEQKVENDVNET